MQIPLKLFDQDLPTPKQATSLAAGIDLYARLTATIPPKSIGYVPLNIAIKLPADTWALMAARSSLHKKGLMLANGIGVGDADYAGDQDEYQAALYNFSDQPSTVERGERIVQLIVMPRTTAQLKLVKALGESNRGGFGSTGRK